MVCHQKCLFANVVLSVIKDLQSTVEFKNNSSQKKNTIFLVKMICDAVELRIKNN